jgi:hypothetical protein
MRDHGFLLFPRCAMIRTRIFELHEITKRWKIFQREWDARAYISRVIGAPYKINRPSIGAMQHR